jgi:antitoxin component YwqK of YwqJK toxin-antitoxin module
VRIYAQSNTFTVYENNLTIKGITTLKKPFCKSKNKNYYWYKKNTIQNTQGGFDGSLLNGKYTEFYSNGQLKTQGQFCKGLKYGIWYFWRQDGVLEQTTHFCSGYKYGNECDYDFKGIKTKQSHFKKGLLQGKVITYKDGKKDSFVCYKKGKEVSSTPRSNFISITWHKLFKKS